MIYNKKTFLKKHFFKIFIYFYFKKLLIKLVHFLLHSLLFRLQFLVYTVLISSPNVFNIFFLNLISLSSLRLNLNLN